MTSFHRYSRPAPVLPPADSLPFPGNLVRECSECGLRAGCRAPVPGDGITPADIMLVGQNPGFNEDSENKPFIGQAGQYLDSLLFQAGIPRSNVYISNLVKCLTVGNRVPTVAEIKACSKWLDLELSIVQPRIIVAMGAPAIARFLGPGAGTVEHLHGKPVEVDGRIILPCYHPAAALRNTTLLRQCSEDFQVLRGLAKGHDISIYHVQDEYPDPDYKIADTPEAMAVLKSLAETVGEFSIDTETCQGKLWSMQISVRPGTAWFVPLRGVDRVDLSDWKATAIMHNYLFDVQYVKVADDRFLDTMVMSYLAGQVQGLKELASRLCGIKMQTYSETVRAGQRKLSLAYLTKTQEQEWPDPPPIEETKWDNKQGKLVTKNRKPWHISRKVNKILDDMKADPEVDPFERWKNIPEEERQVVESVLGAMPESSLADIPIEQAVQYACRDSDATLRVYYKLKQMISDLDLEYVLKMDTDILPMVYSMMQNGMAVNVDYLRELSVDYDARLRAKATELASMVGHAFNPMSSPQVATVIYGELGFKPTSFTPSKLISTDDAELKKTNHPVAKGIIQYRGLLKLKSTYADALVEWARPDENGIPRVHTTLKTTRVETGRLSSADPNLQNIPTRNKEAKAIKNAFIAPEGRVLIEADYSQIEMVTLAHLSKCKRLIELFLRGGDPHTEMAATVFNKPLEDAKQEKYRYPVKRLNFGVAYLIGPQGLSNQIQEYIADLLMDGTPVEIDPWDEPTCENFIKKWYELNPEVKDFQMEKAADARRYGYVTDLFGRMRYIPEVTCPIRSIQEAGLRQAANMPVTATAQGIIKLAMGELWRGLPKTGWQDSIKFLLQIHDSLLFEVCDDDKLIRRALPWIRNIMTGVVKLVVPVKADFKIGHRWGEMSKFEF